MKKSILCMAVWLALAGAFPAAAADGLSGDRMAGQPESAVVSADYLIGPGDIIEISVWKEEALTKAVVVLPDGRISFPLIGEIQAAGRTLPDLKQEIVTKIAKYAPKEEVNLEVKQVNSMFLYVIGRVNQPGRFSLNTNVNVLQALSIAGGLNPFAKRNQIKVFRQEGARTTILKFSYDDVTDGEKLEQNITLKRGDVIVVP
ncbi:MAG TPA: polysaccharide biosynthesis/export family protein [Syntrophales bacterium]|nr:polysaccharide biosynthesis/export family protein [Syntrophales bacterium]